MCILAHIRPLGMIHRENPATIKNEQLPYTSVPPFPAPSRQRFGGGRSRPSPATRFSTFERYCPAASQCYRSREPEIREKRLSGKIPSACKNSCRFDQSAKNICHFGCDLHFDAFVGRPLHDVSLQEELEILIFRSGKTVLSGSGVC